MLKIIIHVERKIKLFEEFWSNTFSNYIYFLIKLFWIKFIFMHWIHTLYWSPIKENYIFLYLNIQRKIWEKNLKKKKIKIKVWGKYIFIIIQFSLPIFFLIWMVKFFLKKEIYNFFYSFSFLIYIYIHIFFFSLLIFQSWKL